MSFCDRLEKRRLLAAGGPDHIVVVIEENRSTPEIIGSADAPFMNFLAQNGLTFADSHGETHPSQPNYLALFSGSTHGVIDNSGPYDFINVPSLGGQLFATGKSFIGYAEDLPQVGSLVLSEGHYDRRHNPWVDFDDVPIASNRPFSDFPADYSTLSTVSFVVPNELHNSHDGPVPDADRWLEANLGGYAAWAKTHNSLLIITWDEGFDLDNHIPTIFYGADVKPGQYLPTIHHYNVLRTIEDAYGLTPLGEALHSPGIDYANLASTPDLTAASDSGADQTDNITNIAAPTFTGTAATGQNVMLFSDNLEIGHIVAANGVYSITSTPLPEGIHQITAAIVDSGGNLLTQSSPLPVTIDRTGPKVASIQFNGQAASANIRRISINFNEVRSVSLPQLVVHNDSTGKSVSSSAMAMTYTPLNNQAFWTFPGLPMGLLANGAYTATLSAAVTDLAGNPLDGNADGTSGDARVFQFFQLTGDANADGAVNDSDFKMLYSRYGATGTSEPADFNGDGQVGFVDFQILELNYGRSIPVAAVRVTESASPLHATPPKPLRTARQPLFAKKPIARR